MVFCIQASLEFQNAQRRDQVLADAEQRIVGKQRFGVDQLLAVTSRQGNPSILLTLRFTSRADMDDLAARIEAFAVGQLQPLPGSWWQIHPCPHDESGGTCVIETRRDF